jgi:hypothetical protein
MKVPYVDPNHSNRQVHTKAIMVGCHHEHESCQALAKKKNPALVNSTTATSNTATALLP